MRDAARQQRALQALLTKAHGITTLGAPWTAEDAAAAREQGRRLARLLRRFIDAEALTLRTMAEAGFLDEHREEIRRRLTTFKEVFGGDRIRALLREAIELERAPRAAATSA